MAKRKARATARGVLFVPHLPTYHPTNEDLFAGKRARRAIWGALGGGDLLANGRLLEVEELFAEG
jgi:hypothetical protein